MSQETATIVPAAAPAPAPVANVVKKVKAPKAPKEKPSHPAWADMMVSAVAALNEKGGSSIPAIKKWIVANNKVDAEKVTPHLRRGVKAALTSGKLVQVTGKGLAGSFKLGKKPTKSAATAKPAKKNKAPAAVMKKAGEKTAKIAKPKAVPAKPKAAKSPKAAKPAAKKTVKAKSVTPKKAAKPKAAAKQPKAPRAPKPKTIKKAKVAAVAKPTASK